MARLKIERSANVAADMGINEVHQTDSQFVFLLSKEIKAIDYLLPSPKP